MAARLAQIWVRAEKQRPPCEERAAGQAGGVCPSCGQRPAARPTWSPPDTSQRFAWPAERQDSITRATGHGRTWRVNSVESGNVTG